MRVVIYTPFFHPKVGGIETFSDVLAAGLAERGLDVRLLAATPLGSAAELDRPYEVRRGHTSGRGEPWLADADALISVGPSVRLLGAARRRGVPTVLVHQGPAGVCPLSIAWRDNRPCSVGVRCLTCKVSGQTVAENVRLLGRFSALRWGMRRAAANVFISRYLRERVCPGHGEVIWNCYDPRIYHPCCGTDFKSVPRSGGPVRFTFVGRLVPLKGVDVAVRAFAAATRRGLDARLRVVGEGPSGPPSRQLAAELGVADRVEFLPFQGPARLADTYRDSDALLFPSQWEEPFGIILAEAMGCGCPVIASHHGAPPEILGDSGLLAPPSDVEAWADRMLQLGQDPALRQRLAEGAARRALENFSLPVMLDRYRDVLERVRRPQAARQELRNRAGITSV
jgi:glycosyltransferase involved in cell wall biosynthesis